MTVLLWFRLDLRLADNLALLAAAKAGPVVPVFIYAPSGEGEAAPGAASRWWLHQSLAALDRSLRERGSRLILRQGDPAKTLVTLCQETGARAVYCNRRYEPAIVARDQKLQEELAAAGIEVNSFNSALLFEPHTIATTTGGPYTVFTPFSRACLNKPPPEAAEPAPARIRAPRNWPASEPLATLGLEPTIDWAGGLRESWQPGEQGAEARLQRFIAEALSNYGEGRNRPDRQGVSRLSPHLHFGEISPRAVWHALALDASASRDTFARELLWREFAYHLLAHFPQTTSKPLQRKFDAFPWVRDKRALVAWQKGRTGYPLVDAGLRELWHTGFMHNRVRMVVASFLVKHLLLPWQQGAAWFWDTLVDADLANNTLGWQWVAGSGADAAPFFRIFNPVLQGEKFDPEAHYVRKWVPELGALPNRYVHRPWAAPARVLAEAGVTLGKTYANPIVDHAFARRRALEAFRQIQRPPVAKARS